MARVSNAFEDLKMIAIFWVYIWGYQLDARFGSLLGCMQIIFLQNHLAFPTQVTWMCSKVHWIVEYKIIVWFKLSIYYWEQRF